VAESRAQTPRIIAIANQKGGVGKTTTAINLATAIAATKRRVLIIDFDPQGNASTALGVDKRACPTNSYDVVMGDATLQAALVDTGIPGLTLVPSCEDLSGAEVELVDAEGRERRLQRALAQVTDFDFILIDCPPSLNLLTVNALVAAQSVMVPLQCEFLALEGISLLVKTIERVKASLNPSLDLHGIVLTMFDKRNNLSDEVAADVRGYFGDKVFKTVIPRNVRVSEAPSYGKPVLLYDWRCAGSEAYVHLAGEVLRREKELAA
jgi:chromosome partitioning protein